MKKNTTPGKNLLSTFYCNLFGHHYVVSNKVTEHIKEYKCIHCQKQVTTDASGNLSDLTPKLKEINDTLRDMYQKRNRRVRTRHVA